jgi:hypothetical protein
MSTGQVDLGDLSKRLSTEDADRTAYIRALFRRTGGGWELRHSTVVVGLEPPGSTNETWEYEEAALVACPMPVGRLLALCREVVGGTAMLGEFTVTVPRPRMSVSWRHEPAYARLDNLALDRPTMHYTFHAEVTDTVSWSPTMLVGSGCPSFVELSTAWRAFTEGDSAKGRSVRARCAAARRPSAAVADEPADGPRRPEATAREVPGCGGSLLVRRLTCRRPRPYVYCGTSPRSHPDQRHHPAGRLRRRSRAGCSSRWRAWPSRLPLNVRISIIQPNVAESRMDSDEATQVERAGSTVCSRTVCEDPLLLGAPRHGQECSKDCT